MKAERRHELKESDLAKELGKAGIFIKDNLRTLAIALVVVVVALFLGVRAVNQHIQTKQAEWRDFHHLLVGPSQDPAGDRGRLLALAEATGQDALAAWAYVRAGELAHVELIEKRYTLAPDEIEALLGDARSAYQTALSQYADQPRAVAKAHLGLGRLAADEGDIATARVEYAAAAAMVSEGAQLIAREALALNDALDSAPPVVVLASRPATTQPDASDDVDADVDADVDGDEDGEDAEDHEHVDVDVDE